jgi:hypothetical protein
MIALGRRVSAWIACACLACWLTAAPAHTSSPQTAKVPTGRAQPGGQRLNGLLSKFPLGTERIRTTPTPQPPVPAASVAVPTPAPKRTSIAKRRPGGIGLVWIVVPVALAGALLGGLLVFRRRTGGLATDPGGTPWPIVDVRQAPGPVVQDESTCNKSTAVVTNRRSIQDALARAAEIRRDAETEAAAQAAALTREAEKVRAEAEVDAGDTRHAGESYATQHRREAEEQSAQLVAEASEQARATREASEAMAKQIEAAARERQQTLSAEVQIVEAKMKRALEGLREIGSQLEDLLALTSETSGGESIVDDLGLDSRRTGSPLGT